MKRILITGIILQAALAMAGCASAFKTASVGDDLYEIHNKTEIAKRQQAEAELAKAQAEARRAQWEAKIAEAQAAAATSGTATTTYGTTQVNPYEAVLADDYESAYARRLYGFSSPTYRMPSSYYSLRYSDAFSYATAYDPAFYNVMVSGDQVWVEPKYITSMFGTWGATVAVPSYSWYYGWSSPHISAWWGYPRYSWYDWSWGYDPYWGFAWGYPYYHHHYHYHPEPAYPHPGGGGGRPYGGNIVHRPHNGGNAGYNGGTRGNTGGYYNGTVRRGSGSTVGSGVYRGNSGSGQYRGNGNSGQYRGNSNSGQYRGNNSTRSDNDSWNSRSESNSFRSNSGSSYRNNSSSGSYGGGYSGGGNYSGGSHGGGQRRR